MGCGPDARVQVLGKAQLCDSVSQLSSREDDTTPLMGLLGGSNGLAQGWHRTSRRYMLALIIRLLLLAIPFFFFNVIP